MAEFTQGDQVVATTAANGEVGGVYLYEAFAGHHAVRVHVWDNAAAIFPTNRLRHAVRLPAAIRDEMRRVEDELNAQLEAQGVDYRVHWAES